MTDRNPNRSSSSAKREKVATGVYKRHTESGIAYYVEDGTGRERMFATFDKKEDAIAYKAELKRCRRQNLTRPSKDEWYQSRSQKELGSGGGKLTRRSTCREVISALDKRVASRSEYPSENMSLSTNGGILLRFLEEHGLDEGPLGNVDAEHADEFRDWLRDENYAKGNQNLILAYVKQVFEQAIRYKVISSSPFVGVKISGEETGIDRRGCARPDGDWRAWDPSEIVAAARTLPRRYLPIFWLCLLALLRVGEALGLQIRDYDPKKRQLSIRRQRQSSPKKGTKPPKTRAGVRTIPLCEALCVLLDEVIRLEHPPEPDDPQERVEWGKRYILQGSHQTPLDRVTAKNAVKRAFALIGLTQDTCGFWFAPMHHLRKTMSTWLQRDLLGGLGAALSYYLGHKTKLTDGFLEASRTTTVTYNEAITQSSPLWGLVERIRDLIDVLVERDLLPLLGTSNLLEVSGLANPMSLEAAAQLMGVKPDGTSWTAVDITTLCREGELDGMAVREPGKVKEAVLVVSAEGLRAFKARLIRTESETYSASDAAARLRTTHSMLYDWEAKGYLTTVRLNERSRNIHGPVMILPGGGHRFRRDEIDYLAALNAERFNKLDTTLTVAETAAILGCSRDTVRRLIDRGEERGGINGWVDDASYRKERHAYLDSVERFQRAHAALTIDQAAIAVGRSAQWIYAHIKSRALRKVSISQPPHRQRLVYLTDIETIAGTVDTVRLGITPVLDLQ